MATAVARDKLITESDGVDLRLSDEEARALSYLLGFVGGDRDNVVAGIRDALNEAGYRVSTYTVDGKFGVIMTGSVMVQPPAAAFFKNKGTVFGR